jgi:(4-(4-[2-(gamma-L-glutamylamino)ethyl]phenoxymethyl)furan-2-yl)methanamine synthase
MSWLALDIGGANLKAADGLGFAAARPFAVWRDPERLSVELEALIAASPACDRIAVTMTAELADCYETKAAGVRAIVDAVKFAAKGRSLVIYLTDARLASADDARERPLLAAASNWHALAAFANRFVTSWPALLLDMGSTTTDIIPLNSSGPCAAGRTDPERLASGELVYMGVERTPVSAVVRSLPWCGGTYPVAAELFATTADAYLTLGLLAEDATHTDSADGRPRTRAAARARLARMLCADSDSFSDKDAELAAAGIRDAQLDVLEAGLRQVVERFSQAPRQVIVSGHGEFLLRVLLERLPWSCEVLSLSKKLGPTVSRCAPAHALAVLAREKAAKRAE